MRRLALQLILVLFFVLLGAFGGIVAGFTVNSDRERSIPQISTPDDITGQVSMDGNEPSTTGLPHNFAVQRPADSNRFVELRNSFSRATRLSENGQESRSAAMLPRLSEQLLDSAKVVQWSKEVLATLTLVQVTSQPGNCNGDETVSSADITGLVLEIFDGDGTEPADASGGAFAGTAACDANEDGTINAADIICVVLIIFNGPGSCRIPAGGI